MRGGQATYRLMGSSRLPARLLALLIPTLLLAALSASAQSGHVFQPASVNVKPQAGTQVYPGSSNVEVDVDYIYSGTVPAKVSAACLKLPKGFTPSRGYTSCSPAYTPNGTIYSTVEPGAQVRFHYMIDVDRNVTPGTYTVEVTITYYLESNGTLEGPYSETHVFTVNVSHYPPVKLKVITAYLAPYGYPGSRSQLNIILYNNGSSTVTGGALKLILPPGFTSDTSVVQLSALPPGATETLSVTVTVSPSVEPGTYMATLKGTATALTPDNVAYTQPIRLDFSFTVNSPPSDIVSIVDKGFTVAPAGRAAQTKAYISIQVAQPDVTVYNVLARWHIEGGWFVNGSSAALSYVSGVYNYGDVIVVESPPLIVANDNVVVTVTLDILASQGGSTFWVKVVSRIEASLESLKPKLRVVNVYWREGVAYPGSSSLDLSVVLENDEPATIESLTAILQLPRGVFEPSNLTVHISRPIEAYRQFSLDFNGIHVSSSAKPGVYTAELIVKGTLRLLDGSYTNFTEKLKVELRVSSQFGNPLQLLALSPRSYDLVEGMVHAGFTVTLRVVKPVEISNLYIEVKAIGPIRFLGKPYATLAGSYGYGSLIQATINGVTVEQGSGGENATILIIVRGLASFNGAEYWFEQVFTRNVTIRSAVLNLTLVDASFEPLLASKGYVSGGRILLSLMNLNDYNVDQIVARVCLLNAKYLDGSKCKAITVKTRLAYGDEITVSTPQIEASNVSGGVKAHVYIVAKITVEGASYLAARELNVTVPLRGNYRPLKLCCSETLYDNQPAPLLPGQHNVQLRLTLVNSAPYPIASTSIRAVAPGGFNITAIGGTCLTGVAPGSSCTITLTMDISSTIEPGIYRLNLTLEPTVSAGNTVTVFSENLTVHLVVQPVEKYTPKLKLLWAGWSTNNGIVYSGSGLATLQVQIYNPSRWPASGVAGRIETVNASITVVSGASYCSQLLSPGSACTLLFTVNLERANPGVAVYNLTLSYLVRVYGINRLVEERYVVAVPIHAYTELQGLNLIGYGWLNGWHVYPNTTNATYTVTLANLNPYPIGGVYAELILPKGFSAVDRAGNPRAYLAGPIQPLGKFTLSFNVRIGNIEPGEYKALLIVKYVPQVRGVTEFKKANFTVFLKVSSLRKDVELVSVRWVGAVPQPDTKGALLEVYFRNDNVAVMRAPVIHVITPANVTCSVNNATEATLPALTSAQYTALSTIASRGGVEELLQAIGRLASSQSQQVILPGSVFHVLIPLNLYLSTPQRFTLRIGLDFIDQWGVKREIYYTVGVPPYGSTKLIKVSAPRSVAFYNGVGRTYVNITNVGWGPLYNVYVYILPQTPLVTVSDNMFYIGRLGPGETVELNFTLYYNPLSTKYFGGSVGEYSSIPLMVAIAFKDYSGFEGNLNLTVSLKAQPLIDLRFGPDLKVERRGSVVYAGGTIENHGISKAYSVAVYLQVGNATSSTFLGDVDAGGQTAFRVEVKAPSARGNATLLLVYRDAYGGEHVVRVVKPISIAAINTTTVKPSESRSVIKGYAAAVIAGVAVFLALAAYLIYRLVRRHERRLEGV